MPITPDTLISDPQPAPAIAAAPSFDEKAKTRARKKKKAAERAGEIRKLYWPTITEDKLWLLDGERGGFAQVPRTLSLFSELIIKKALKLKTGVSSAAGTTYNVLWLHTQGQGISRIDNEEDAALEAGYGGERALTTFRKHVRDLKELGFIDFVEESRGRVKWVLMLNPYVVLKELYAKSLVDKRHFAAIMDRLDQLNSGDELKEGDDDAE